MLSSARTGFAQQSLAALQQRCLAEGRQGPIDPIRYLEPWVERIPADLLVFLRSADAADAPDPHLWCSTRACSAAQRPRRDLHREAECRLLLKSTDKH